MLNTLKRLIITTNSNSVCNSHFIVAVNNFDFASNLVKHYSCGVGNVLQCFVENSFRIGTESAEFCRRYDKNIRLPFSWTRFSRFLRQVR